MAKEVIKLPSLDNATPASITDDLGRVKRRLKILKKYEGYLKEALNARRGDEILVTEGEKYKSELKKDIKQLRLSKDLVEKYVSPELLPKLFAEIKFDRLEVRTLGVEEDVDLLADNDDDLWEE